VKAAPKPAAKPKDVEWVGAPKAAVLGDVQVSIPDLVIGKIPVKTFSGETTSKEDGLPDCGKANLGRKAGLSKAVRPHGLRHEAITSALDKTNGDVRTVQRFSRHADTRTVLLYDDRRRDVAGDVAKLVAGDD
jgi:hypothetical protein